LPKKNTKPESKAKTKNINSITQKKDTDIVEDDVHPEDYKDSVRLIKKDTKKSDEDIKGKEIVLEEHSSEADLSEVEENKRPK